MACVPALGKVELLTYARKSRLLDLLIAIPASIVTLPCILVLAIGSAISFRAWPFFTQLRLGHHGAEFRFIKIRSLPVTTPAAVDKYELKALANTRFGGFLRRFHFDELPQLWLVVWGTMSLVGPRPEMPCVAATFAPGFVATRLTVKPGCTGLWQISTASVGLIGDNPKYDLVLVHSESVRLDLWVIVRTPFHMLGAHSVRSLDDVPGWVRSDALTAAMVAAA